LSIVIETLLDFQGFEFQIFCWIVVACFRVHSHMRFWKENIVLIFQVYLPFYVFQKWIIFQLKIAIRLLLGRARLYKPKTQFKITP
jgi:hypothetical protein